MHKRPLYEKVTILSIPMKGHTAADVLADFNKLDLWCTRFDSEYPEDDINYCEGKVRKSHPLHKISKYYGRNKDVFLFLATIRNEKMNSMIMKMVGNKVDNDPQVLEEFTKKIETHLNRASEGEGEANVFLNNNESGQEMVAFFNGTHAHHPGRPRNIHENLNINVLKPDKELDISEFFKRTTPLMDAEKSELKKVKIFANGDRVMNVFKDDQGKRNYVYTKQADLHLEIGWNAKNTKGDELFCVVTLKINGGKVVLKKMSVEGEHPNAVVSIPELAKQNNSVLVKSKNLHELLDRLVIHRSKEAALEIACVVQSCSPDKPPQPVVSTERFYVSILPKKVPGPDKEVYADFEKLSFSEGPFEASDELNYYDGLEGNPFDKIAQYYARRKDIFIFHNIVVNPEKRAIVLGIVEEKCRQFDDPILLMAQFKTQMDIYLERLSAGKQDAKKLVKGDGFNSFFSGRYIAKKYHPRNIHANLHVNVTKQSRPLHVSNVMKTVIPRMTTEKSKLERLKVFGNGKRIMTVTKGDYRKRNYVFSSVATMELEIEWIGRETRSQRDVRCCLVLEIKGGKISMKSATLDGNVVKLATIYPYAIENKDVLIRNMSLGKVLEIIFDSLVGGTPPLTIGNIKATIQPSLGGRLPNSIFDCHSHESLNVKLIQQPVDFSKLFDHPDFEDVLEDFEKLDFSPGPFNPDDKLNYNDGQKANPFTRIRKYYSKYKDIFLFIAVLYDEDQKAKVLEIAKRKAGRDPSTLVEFVKTMKVFLDRATQGRKDAMNFLGREYCRGLVAFFAGTQSGYRRNMHSILNIDLGVSGKTFDITRYFHRHTPQWNRCHSRGELESVKIYGNGKRIATVFKKGVGQRNYTCSKFAELALEIRWKALEFGSAFTRRCQERECFVILKFKNGDVTISKAALDGQVIQAASILELAKQNDKVFFRNKSLYDVMHFSSLKAAIKGATSLFYTASHGTETEADPTRTTSNCADVLLMLMLQDEEEKERILDMVSARSARPEETRQEFEDKIILFQERYASGGYQTQTPTPESEFEEPVPGPSRAMTENIPFEQRALAVPKRRLGGINSIPWRGCDGLGQQALGPPEASEVAATECMVVGEGDFGYAGMEGAWGGAGNFGTIEYDDEEMENRMMGAQSLILLGAEAHPIELLRNVDWKAPGPN